MAKHLSSYYRDRPFLVEVFVLFNVAFLILDVLIAHAMNEFAHWAEWIPVAFSGIATIILIAGLVMRGSYDTGWPRKLGYWVGWGAIVVGVSGLLLHLESQFFERATIHNLVYSAPFAAPLAYTGLGLLLLLNRKVSTSSTEWGQWVLFLAWGGFIGNFALSLADHAQNGFFYPTEWIAVASSAFAVGFLIIAILRPTAKPFLKACFGILALQALVGLLGFIFHLSANLPVSEAGLRYDFVYGAPVFAPLLFLDISVLAAIGLWDLMEKSTVPQTAV